MLTRLKSSKSAQVPPGLYKHYKGGVYQVIGSVRHSETREDFIVYKALHGRQTWARPVSMFVEAVLLDGRWTPRFAQLQQQVRSSNQVAWAQLELFA